MLDSPDLLSREFYGDRLVTLPARMCTPNAVEREPGERLGRYFERLVHSSVASLQPTRQHSGLKITEGKRTVGELDIVFQLPGEDVTRHWELSVKYYLQVGNVFVGLLLRDRLDLKLRKLFGQQLALTDIPATRTRLAELGYPPTIVSQALVKGTLFYAPGATASIPPEVSPEHARGTWTLGTDMGFNDERTHCVVTPTWLQAATTLHKG